MLVLSLILAGSFAYFWLTRNPRQPRRMWKRIADVVVLFIVLVVGMLWLSTLTGP